jgi:hypothetical protein
MSYCMGLYGIYGEHTQEACPLYNEDQIFLFELGMNQTD